MNNPLGVKNRGQKIFSLPRVVPCFPLLGLTPSGLFMGLCSTQIYTSELILWFHYLCSQCYAAQHSYVPLLSIRRDSPSKIVPDFLCAIPCVPLLGLTPSGLFMGLCSTQIYTLELILWFHYSCSFMVCLLSPWCFSISVNYFFRVSLNLKVIFTGPAK